MDSAVVEAMGVALSSISVSGVAEETIAGLMVASIAGLVVWREGRERVGRYASRFGARSVAWWRWVKASHIFTKIALLWWVSITAVSVSDAYVAPVPDLAFNLCAAWFMGMLGTLGILWLRRRFSQATG